MRKKINLFLLLVISFLAITNPAIAQNFGNNTVYQTSGTPNIPYTNLDSVISNPNSGPVMVTQNNNQKTVETKEYQPISGSGLLKTLGISQDDISNLPKFVGAIYSFGIAIAVLLAVIMLMWGGIKKMTTESYTGKSDAKEKITNAFQGLGLALASYLLLYIINPCLVDFFGSKGCEEKNTFLYPSKTVYTPPASNYPTSSDTSSGPSCNNCVNGSTYGLECKDGCQMNESLAKKLQDVLNENDARVTEGYPPTPGVNHLDSCHNKGTCVDINFKDRSTDVERVKKLYNALVATGLHVVYESPNCKPYQDVGVNCKLYTTTTYTSFHAEL